MCSYKANVNEADCKFYDGYNSVSITFDIEYIALISNTIYTIKRLLYIRVACPMTILHDVCPYLQWQQSIGMKSGKFFQRFFSEYPH